MNNSRTFAAVLSGLTLLTVSALAQSGGSGSGSSSSSSGSNSGATGVRSSTTSPASTSATPSATPSGSTVATPSTTTPGAMNSSNANIDVNGNATASQFKSFDTDADGRISRAEFAASGIAAASLHGSSDTSATSATGTDSTKGEKKHWWSRSSDKSADSDPAAEFAKLDTDNDGFLSQSELAHAKK